MPNLVIYLVIGGMLIWAFNAFKEMLVKKALDNVDKKIEVVQEERKEIQSHIDGEEARLKVIEAEESAKTQKEAVDFWNKK